MLKGLEHPSCVERLRELELFSLRKRKVMKKKVDLISVHKYLKGVFIEAGARLSSVVLSIRTRGNRHKLWER